MRHQCNICGRAYDRCSDCDSDRSGRHSYEPRTSTFDMLLVIAGMCILTLILIRWVSVTG